VVRTTKNAEKISAVGRLCMVFVLVFVLPVANGARLWCYCACAGAERRENAKFAKLRLEKVWVVKGHY